MYYNCYEVVDGVCTVWAEAGVLPEGSGLIIGGSLLLVTITAWGFRYIADFLLNRR